MAYPGMHPDWRKVASLMTATRAAGVTILAIAIALGFISIPLSDASFRAMLYPIGVLLGIAIGMILLS